jgi:hypothetical protein
MLLTSSLTRRLLTPGLRARNALRRIQPWPKTLPTWADAASGTPAPLYLAPPDFYTKMATPLVQRQPPLATQNLTSISFEEAFAMFRGMTAPLQCQLTGRSNCFENPQAFRRQGQLADFFTVGPGVLLLRPLRGSRHSYVYLNHLPTDMLPGLAPYRGRLVFDENFNIISQEGTDYQILSSAMFELIVRYHAGTLHLGETNFPHLISAAAGPRLREALTPFLTIDPTSSTAAHQVLAGEHGYFTKLFGLTPTALTAYLTRCSTEGYDDFGERWRWIQRFNSPLHKLPYYCQGIELRHRLEAYLGATLKPSIGREPVHVMEATLVNLAVEYLTRSILDHHYFNYIYAWQVDVDASGPVIVEGRDGCPREYYELMLPILVGTCFNRTAKISDRSHPPGLPTELLQSLELHHLPLIHSRAHPERYTFLDQRLGYRRDQ